MRIVPRLCRPRTRLTHAARIRVQHWVAICLLKFDYLNRVPWIFSRCHDIQTCKEIIVQVATRPLKEHHRRVQEAMEPESPTCLAIHSRAGGGEVTQALIDLRDEFANGSFHDQIAEMPHAKASKIGGHSNASKWPFDSSSCRLVQNLDDKEWMVQAANVDFQAEWNDVKKVLQMNTERSGRPVKAKWKDVVEAVYFFRPDMSKYTDGKDEANK